MHQVKICLQGKEQDGVEIVECVESFYLGFFRAIGARKIYFSGNRSDVLHVFDTRGNHLKFENITQEAK